MIALCPNNPDPRYETISDLDTRESNRTHGLIRRFALPRRNHYQRPLEEAIHSHASQWPKAWQGKNPLSGGRNFATMTPEERVRLISGECSTYKGTDDIGLVATTKVDDYLVPVVLRSRPS